MNKLIKDLELTKGMLIRKTKENTDPMFSNTTANEVLTYEVTRVNKKTYGLKCVEGYMVGSSCNLYKDAEIESIDVYGTKTTYAIV